ncbi:hypothetical protein BE18_11945 [Sorangium cellulosum]|uniref:Uncharacterized protein n=1 Tax=Sorangium cellulosum TaxID=56 RepID=A0A150RRH7_SORCE|nr:hypothetical protein BE18_11945 [Sorangium cellulosum]
MSRPSTTASSPARADRSITGTMLVLGSARSSRRRETPSSPGMITSLTTRSGGRASAASRAARPSETASTFHLGERRWTR